MEGYSTFAVTYVCLIQIDSIASISADQCSKLIMYGGIIQNNSATVREGGGIALLFTTRIHSLVFLLIRTSSKPRSIRSIAIYIQTAVNQDFSCRAPG